MNAPDLPPLVYLGTPALMRSQEPVDPRAISSDDFQERLDTLARAMAHYGGIGIAAPQIGWDARVFCFGIPRHSPRYPGAEPIDFEIWINPVLEPVGSAQNWAWEGCLSVPGMRGWVARPAAVRIRGLDGKGKRQESIKGDFAARVAQHEADHLDGILFPMRVTEPRWLLPDAVLAGQAGWKADWPSPGARATGPGELSEVA